MIHNAIGGRKRVTGFICRTCNSISGSKWDAELVRQVAPLSSLLGISRQRGNAPPYTFPTYSGAGVTLNPDGRMTPSKPTIQITSEGTTDKFHVKARSKSELRKILKALQAKFPRLKDLNLDNILSKAQHTSNYTSDPMAIEGSFGGTTAGRSLVKSAVALAFCAGVPPEQCNLAMDYLLNDDGEACFGYYYEKGRDLVTDRPQNVPFHCIYVKGSQEHSTIVGYIEIYGLWRTVLCLSRTYAGEDFSHTYAIDPIKGEELDIRVDLSLSLSEIREAYEYHRYDESVFIDALDNVMAMCKEMDFSRAMSQAAEHAIATSCVSIGINEGDVLTDDQIEALSKQMAERMMPFIQHNMRFLGNRIHSTDLSQGQGSV